MSGQLPRLANLTDHRRLWFIEGSLEQSEVALDLSPLLGCCFQFF